MAADGVTAQFLSSRTTSRWCDVVIGRFGAGGQLEQGVGPAGRQVQSRKSGSRSRALHIDLCLLTESNSHDKLVPKLDSLNCSLRGQPPRCSRGVDPADSEDRTFGRWESA